MPYGRVIQRQSPILNVGRLRHKVDIATFSGAQDSTGGFTPATVVYANCWASIEALTGVEKFAAHEFVSQVSHQVVIRYIGAAPQWNATYNYITGALVLDSNGNLQQAQAGGLSGSTQPSWNPTKGGTTSDGDPSTGIVWVNLGVPLLRTGVTSGMVVWFQGRTFQIEAVQNPDERNKILILLCVEINDSRQQNGVTQPTGLV
jgi:head-tail adaptor